jgi:hypothetical protein
VTLQSELKSGTQNPISVSDRTATQSEVARGVSIRRVKDVQDAQLVEFAEGFPAVVSRGSSVPSPSNYCRNSNSLAQIEISVSDRTVTSLAGRRSVASRLNEFSAEPRKRRSRDVDRWCQKL